MKKIVVITAEFNIMTGEKNKPCGKNEREGLYKEWILRKMDTFMKFTGQCLINQSDKSFVAIYVFEDYLENLIEDAINNYEKLPSNIKFVKKSEYIKILEEVAEGFDLLLLSKLSSDNLYCNHFVQKLMNYDLKEDTQRLLCQSGYIYDCENNKLAEYYEKQFMFCTLVYRLRGNNKLSTIGVSSTEILKEKLDFSEVYYKYEVLDGRNFIIVINNYDINNSFSDYNYGSNQIESIIDNQQEIEDILYDFL